MKKTNIFYIVLGVIFLASVGLIYAQSSAPGEYDQFAQCLTENDATFYGAWWCPHCKTQREMFGKSVKYVNYVECSTSDRQLTQVCANANIQSFPTWEFSDGSRLSGTQQFSTLSEKTGCQLN